jgi:hypothetical protein
MSLTNALWANAARMSLTNALRTNVFNEYPLSFILYQERSDLIFNVNEVNLYRSLREHYFLSGACDHA